MPTTNSNYALPAGYKLGEYVIEKVLGHGGFGITYLARDTQLSSRVAIKEFFPRSVAARSGEFTIRPFTNGVEDFRWGLQEFLKEARALAKFKHNHIVRVLRFVEANGTAYMVMEYEEGESLDVYLKRSGGYLNEQMLLSVFIPVLTGLQAVHDIGMLHLDIKPDNIYLRTNGKPMLIDFGSSRQAKGANDVGGKIALTPAYSAIEQYPGIGDSGPWTDVYSMGATLYRCITGQPPVDSLKRYQAKQSKQVDPFVSATEFDRPFFSKHIRESVDAAMQLTEKKRPQTADLLQRALMGQRIADQTGKKTIRPSGNFRPDMITDMGSPMMVTRKKKTRGIFEKLFFFAVLVPAISIFTVKLLVQFNLLSEEQVFQKIDGVKTESTTRLATSINSLDATLYSNLRISIKPRQKVIAAPEPAGVKDTKVVAPRIPSFNINKSVSTTLTGHRGEVFSLVFLRDGAVLASLGGDGEIRLWDTKTGKPIQRLGAKNQIVGAVDGSPDGQSLAWSIGSELFVSNLGERQALARSIDHDSTVRHVRYSTKGDLVATVTGNKTLTVWNAATWGAVFKKETLGWDVTDIRFSQNGRLVALSDSNGEIRIFSATNGAEIARFFGKAQGEELLALAYSPDGHWLASSGPAQFIKLWDTGVEVKDRLLNNVVGSSKKLLFSPDSKWLLAIGSDNRIQIWDVNKGQISGHLETPHGEISSLAISPAGDVVAVGGTDHNISLLR